MFCATRSVWESIRPETSRLDHLAQWEKEFSQFSNKDKQQEDDGDLLDENAAAELGFDLNEYMKDADAREWGGEETMGLEKMRFGEDGFPVLGDYAFGQFRA